MGLLMFEIQPWLIIQALIQGLTEFLPVSSTGHLGLGWAALEASGLNTPTTGDQQIIDIALHLGTLMAVVLYFFGDVTRLYSGGLALFTRQSDRPDPRSLLFVRLIVASIPALLIGMLISDFRETYKNDLGLIAATTILFGCLLFVADRFFLPTTRLKHLSLSGAFLIGIMQCFALVPGVSRSGITITAGRFIGLDRESATRFSMLLSIPIILGAGIFGVLELWGRGELALTQTAIWAIFISFLAALGAIHFMMELARRATFTAFVIYRIGLGITIYALLATGWLPSSMVQF